MKGILVAINPTDYKAPFIAQYATQLSLLLGRQRITLLYVRTPDAPTKIPQLRSLQKKLQEDLTKSQSSSQRSIQIDILERTGNFVDEVRHVEFHGEKSHEKSLSIGGNGLDQELISSHDLSSGDKTKKSMVHQMYSSSQIGTNKLNTRTSSNEPPSPTSGSNTSKYEFIIIGADKKGSKTISLVSDHRSLTPIVVIPPEESTLNNVAWNHVVYACEFDENNPDGSIDTVLFHDFLRIVHRMNQELKHKSENTEDDDLSKTSPRKHTEPIRLSFVHCTSAKEHRFKDIKTKFHSKISNMIDNYENYNIEVLAGENVARTLNAYLNEHHPNLVVMTRMFRGQYVTGYWELRSSVTELEISKEAVLKIPIMIYFHASTVEKQPKLKR